MSGANKEKNVFRDRRVFIVCLWLAVKNGFLACAWPFSLYQKRMKSNILCNVHGKFILGRTGYHV